MKTATESSRVRGILIRSATAFLTAIAGMVGMAFNEVSAAPAGVSLPAIEITPDGRHFQTREGAPFFYLADTAWTAVTRLSPEELDTYLRDRKSKGFTVIQLVMVPWDAASRGDRHGSKPFVDGDIARPNPAFFDEVERVLDQVQSHGMYPAVAPFWLAGTPDAGPEDVARYSAYGKYVGERFGHRQMFWIIGTDRKPVGWENVLRAFSESVRTAAGRTDLLMTNHPHGGQSSGMWLHGEKWVSFNMLQSGHDLRTAQFKLIEQDYARVPTKPVLDGEPAYENIVARLAQYTPEAQLVNDADVRRQAYQAVFAGAAGHAYGCCEVYEFYRMGDGKAKWTKGTPWEEAMQLPGARQMGLLARLVLARSPQTRMPDQSLIVAPISENPDKHIRAMRDRNGTYAYVYLPTGGEVTVDLSRLASERLHYSWFDPRTGDVTAKLEATRGIVTLKAQADQPGHDVVLIVESR